jgi:phage shock protein C
MLMNRRLYRSRTDTVLGGVAAGLANYLNADPALVRIAWAILVPLTGGAAFLAYIIAWVVVPEEPEGWVDPADASRAPASDEASGAGDAPADAPVYAASTPTAAPRSRSDGAGAAFIIGIGLVILGIWFLVREYLPPIDWSLVWPVVLIGTGALILVISMRRRT